MRTVSYVFIWFGAKEFPPINRLCQTNVEWWFNNPIRVTKKEPCCSCENGSRVLYRMSISIRTHLHIG